MRFKLKPSRREINIAPCSEMLMHVEFRLGDGPPLELKDI